VWWVTGTFYGMERQMTAPDRILVKYLLGVVIGIVVVALARISVFPMLGVPVTVSGTGLMGVVVAGLMRGAIAEAYAAGQASGSDAG
jgi:hypothetical protein